MANPCIVTFRGKEYDYPSWIEYLSSEEGLNTLLDEKVLTGIGRLPLLQTEKRSIEVKTEADAYEAFKALGYDDRLAKDNAMLLNAAAEAAQRRYGVDKSDYMTLTLRNFSKAEGMEQGLMQMDLPDGRKVTVKKVSPEVVNGFYSPIEKNLMEYGKDKIKAKDWLNVVGKSDEAVFTGVRTFLEGKDPNAMVSKQEILDYMKDNRISVVEVVKGEAYVRKEKEYKDKAISVGKKFGFNVDFGSENEIELPYSKYEIETIRDREFLSKKDDISIEALEAMVELYKENSKYAYKPNAFYDEGGDVKFRQYQLEGEKENYKEIMVILPRTGSMAKVGDYKVPLVHRYGEDLSDNRRLVHLRMNTRTDANGKKVLFLEEVQSDWGQLGKEAGFAGENIFMAKQKSDGSWDVFQKGIFKKNVFANNEKEAIKIAGYNPDFTGIPTAPFVMDTNAWTKLGLKVALKEAVAQGVDKIAWTTGEQQNDRYDLSKQVKKIEINQLNDGTFDVTTTDLDGEEHNELMRNEKELSDYVGKEIADKVINEGKSIFSGDGLKLGGKGMKGFYGSMEEGTKGIVGGVAEKVFGQKVGETKIDTGVKVYDAEKYNGTQNIEAIPGNEMIQDGDWLIKNLSGDFVYSIDGYLSKSEAIQEFKDIAAEADIVISEGKGLATQPSIDITPELKAQVQEGLPLFQEARGRFSRESGKDVISLLKSKNASTFPHELGHKHLQTIIDISSTNNLAKEDLMTLAKEYVKQKKSSMSAEDIVKALQATDTNLMDNTTYRDVHEFFTNGFEKWLKEGERAGFSKDLVALYEKFKEYLKNVYLSIANKRLDSVELSPELNKLYEQIFGDDWENIKEKEKVAKEDIKNAEIAEAEKAKPISEKAFMDFLTEKGKTADESSMSGFLPAILSHVKQMRANDDVSQYTVEKNLKDKIANASVPEWVKENAIRTIEENLPKILTAAEYKGPLREGFKNTEMSTEVSEAEKKKIRQGDGVTYAKVSLRKLNKNAMDIVQDLTFDELYQAQMDGIIKVDFENDESLSENVALAAAIIKKGRNELKAEMSDEKRADMEVKLADLQEKLNIFGTILGKGLNAMKLLSEVDPKWFINKLKDAYTKEFSVAESSKLGKQIDELKQKYKEVDKFNTDLLYELADKEKLLAEYQKRIEAKNGIKPVASRVRISPDNKKGVDEIKDQEKLIKSQAGLLSKLIKESKLQQAEEELSIDELMKSVGFNMVDVFIQKNKMGVDLTRFTDMMKKEIGEDFDYDYTTLYRGVREELKNKYGEDAFNTDADIDAMVESGQDEMNDINMKIGESNVEGKMDDELKTLRALMKANSDIAKAKVKKLADFAMRKIIESGLWGRYMEKESTRIAGDIERKIYDMMGGKPRTQADKVLLEEFSSTLSANIRGLINEVFPTDKKAIAEVNYYDKLKNISDNKEKFQQVYQSAIDKIVQKYGENPDLKAVLDTLIKNKDVYSSGMLKGAINQFMKGTENNIENFILLEDSAKRSIVDELLKSVAGDRTDLRKALRDELSSMQAELFSGAKNAVADRIISDIEKNVFGKNTKESTLLSKLKGIILSQYTETVKNKKVIENKSMVQLLQDALNEQMTKEGRLMREAISKEISTYIDSRNWSEADKAKAKEFIEDYQRSVFKSLVTAKVGNKVISDLLINRGYARKQTVDGVEKVYPDWKKFVTDVRSYKQGVRSGIVDDITKIVGDSAVANDVLNHIMEIFDNRTTKEANKFLAREISKIAARKNVFASPRKITSKLNALIKIGNAIDGITNEKFRDAFADEFGLSFASKEQLVNLEKLLDKIRDMPEGYLKNFAAERAAAYLDYLKNPNYFMAMQALSSLYGGVLAHPTTSVVNAMTLPEAMLQQTLRALARRDMNYFKVMVKAMTSGILASTVKRGILNMPEDYYAHSNMKYRPDETMHEFLSSDLEITKEIKKGNIGKALRSTYLKWQSKGLATPFAKFDNNTLTISKTFQRINEGVDALVQNISGNGAIYDFFYKKYIKEGMSKAEAAKKAYKDVFPVPYEDAKAIASEDFLRLRMQPSDSEFNYRVNEIIRSYRSKEVNEMATRLGQVTAMRVKPQYYLNAGVFENLAYFVESGYKGVIGPMKDDKKAQTTVAGLKYIAVPFVRTVGHVLDRILDSTGLGVFRGGMRYLKNVAFFESNSALMQDVKKGKLTIEEGKYIEAYKAGRSVADAFVGFALFGVLKAMMSDEDDGFYGENPNATQKQKDNGYRNCVVVQGTKIPYTLLGPYAGTAMVMGNIMDQVRNKEEGDIKIKDPRKLLSDYDTSVTEAIGNTIKGFRNMSFLSNLSFALRNDYKTSAKIGSAITYNLQGAMGVPHRLIKDIYQGIDPTIKSANTFKEGIMKAAPYLELLPVIDAQHKMFDYRGRILTVGDKPSVNISAIIDQFTKEDKEDILDRMFNNINYMVPEQTKSAINYGKKTDRLQISSPEPDELYDIYFATAKFFDRKISNIGIDGFIEKKDEIMTEIEESDEYNDLIPEIKRSKLNEETNRKMKAYIDDMWHEAEAEAMKMYGYSKKADVEKSIETGKPIGE